VKTPSKTHKNFLLSAEFTIKERTEALPYECFIIYRNRIKVFSCAALVQAAKIEKRRKKGLTVRERYANIVKRSKMVEKKTKGERLPEAEQKKFKGI